jgi:saccharopine dehydrogenase (NAD+, L-lysine-forming)
VVVLSTTSDFIDKIAGAALEAKIDYIDIHLCSTRKNEILGGLCDRIVESGLCFITDGGFHPGLPAAMVRYLAPTFTKLESARVGSVIQGDWKSCQQYMSANATDELASEISNMQTTLYKDGKWQNAGLVAMLNPPCMDFGAPFGKRPVIPMHLDEMRCLPVLYPSVKTVGFYVSGFNWAVDYLISPIAIASIMLFPSSKHIMGRFLNWGLTTFSKPPFGTWLKLEATGNDEKGARVEKSLILSHDGAYDLTAIPVAATVMQYLSPDYSVRKPGLWRQAEAVEPRQFFLDMQVMGVQIEPRVS